MTNDQYFGPLFSGEVLRDKGIKQVSSHNETWMESCVYYATNVFVEYNRDRTFTGEDIRAGCVAEFGEPKHPNAWGALINSLVRQKIIKPTGEWRKTKNQSSHARNIQVYMRGG